MKYKEKMCYPGNRKLFVLVIAMFAYTITIAQKKKTDTLAPIRQFVQISSGYKQLPLYLSMEMKSSANFIVNEEDTASVQGEFFLRNDNSYVRFGEFEQVVNDSVALLISNKLQQMILFTDAAPVVQRMRGMMGVMLPDSSIRNLAARYTSVTKSISDKKEAVELVSRQMIPGTSVPGEKIELEYTSGKKVPEKVTTTRRSLLRLDSAQYQLLQQEPALIENLLALEGSYFLIKEQVTSYIYTKIDYGTAVVVPVRINDRVIRSQAGEYLPVKEYDTYRLIIND